MTNETGAATLSPCGRYRYDLTRVWGPGSRICWVMLNPSTADAHHDDPTIRRCSGFAKSWGAGSLVVVNLFGFRATRPADLLAVEDPEGPANRATIREQAETSDWVVAAWGCGWRKVVPHRSIYRWWADLWDGPTWCLGTTMQGDPRHPLYVPKTQARVPWFWPMQERSVR